MTFDRYPVETTRGPQPILFLSPDGMLEPLGAAQVLPYIFGLVQLGCTYEILSLEKERDCVDPRAATALHLRLAAEGISWTHLPYNGRGIRSLFSTYCRTFLEFRRRWKSGKVELVHARSYVMALFARQVTRDRYIFDTRGYWVDERKEAGRWFRVLPLYRLAKHLEFKAARDAAAIVTLTDLQRRDFRATFPSKHIVTIATCVDFNRFHPGASADHVPLPIRIRLAGKLVLGLVGSINQAYRITDSIRLFRWVRAAEPDAHLLCLTRQQLEMRELLFQGEIAQEDFTIESVQHDQIHEWMSLIHWGVLIQEESFATRAMMPTKLGEMFASGVRPVQYGCNEEVTRLVNIAGSGVILGGLSDQDLQVAAAEIVQIGKAKGGITEARARMHSHFSLEVGTKRYSELLTILMNQAVHGK